MAFMVDILDPKFDNLMVDEWDEKQEEDMDSFKVSIS